MHYDPKIPCDAWPLSEDAAKLEREKIFNCEKIFTNGSDTKWNVSTSPIPEQSSKRNTREKQKPSCSHTPHNLDRELCSSCRLKFDKPVYNVKRAEAPSKIAISLEEKAKMGNLQKRVWALEHECKAHAVERRRMSALEQVLMSHLDALRALLLQQEAVLSGQGPRAAVMDESEGRALAKNTAVLARTLEFDYAFAPTRQELPPLFGHELGSKAAATLSQDLLKKVEDKLFTSTSRQVEVAAEAAASCTRKADEKLRECARKQAELEELQAELDRKQNDSSYDHLLGKEHATQQHLRKALEERDAALHREQHHDGQVAKLKAKFQEYQDEVMHSIGNVAETLEKKMGYIPRKIHRELTRIIDLNHDIYYQGYELNKILPSNNFVDTVQVDEDMNRTSYREQRYGGI